MTPCPKPVKREKPPRTSVSRALRAAFPRSRAPRNLASWAEMRDQADEAWARYIKARDGYVCQRCRREGREAHHLRDRRYFPTRWLPENGVTLCRYCHELVGHDSEANRELALSRMTAERWRELITLSRMRMRTDPALCIVALKHLLGELGA